MLRQFLGHRRALRVPSAPALQSVAGRAFLSSSTVAGEHLETLETLETIAARPRRHRFRVALVGRTNVGKSTLFNRLTKSRAAIVHDVPGTTRDRRYAPAQLAGLGFDVIDTGGLEDAPTGGLEEGMLEQTRRAVHEADLVFFLVDGRQGVTPIDAHFARWLRRENPEAPVHLVANKIEGDPDRFDDAINYCFRLGMGSPILLSAEHGEGTTDLLDVLIPAYDAFEKEQDDVQQQWEREHQDKEREGVEGSDGELAVGDDEDEDVR